MTAPAAPTGNMNGMFAGMMLFGTVTTVMGTANQIHQDWLNVKVKEGDLAFQTAGMIHPPPITTR